MHPPFRDVLCCTVLLGGLAFGGAHAADTVTIYRCVDAKGEVTLQDMACPRQEHQDVREMARPVDAPPQPVATSFPKVTRLQPVRMTRTGTPSPLFQCRTPDGQTYTSQTGAGGGRYAAAYTVGLGGQGQARNGRLPADPYPVSTYVHDTCVRLPQDEVCQTLHDRSDELGTMIFNAQPDARTRYEREQRSVENQLRSGCPGT